MDFSILTCLMIIDSYVIIKVFSPKLVRTYLKTILQMCWIAQLTYNYINFIKNTDISTTYM